MGPKDKEHWLAHLDGQIGVISQSVQSFEQARNEADGSSETRYDTMKFNYELDASISRRVRSRQVQFRNEIAAAPKRTEIASGAVAEIAIEADPAERILFMHNHGELPGVQVATFDSPLGKALKGKKVGQSATYRGGESMLTAEICSIE